jgi:hypothetical protein
MPARRAARPRPPRATSMRASPPRWTTPAATWPGRRGCWACRGPRCGGASPGSTPHLDQRPSSVGSSRITSRSAISVSTPL